jgi:glycosyltransferase involved in cell wall biosynthesis
MLSVCIPVFNVNVANLVNALEGQVVKLNIPVEIILIDDHSNEAYTSENRCLKSVITKFIPLQENIGRARIRNLFLKHAQYDNLLFLDCDSEIIKPEFLAIYCEEIKKGSGVICGGRIYAAIRPLRNKRLHWNYGRKKESKSVADRQKNPNASFMTNNFVVKREILEEIKLDERLTGYGHEDTLFGYQLKLRNISVRHIDNPVLHADLHKNNVFMQNTESAIRNLVAILFFMNHDKEFINEITLLKVYTKLKKQKLLFFVKPIYFILSPLVRALLCAGFANMFLLDFYKLGYLSMACSKHLINKT